MVVLYVAFATTVLRSVQFTAGKERQKSKLFSAWNSDILCDLEIIANLNGSDAVHKSARGARLLLLLLLVPSPFSPDGSCPPGTKCLEECSKQQQCVSFVGWLTRIFFHFNLPAYWTHVPHRSPSTDNRLIRPVTTTRHDNTKVVAMRTQKQLCFTNWHASNEAREDVYGEIRQRAGQSLLSIVS